MGTATDPTARFGNVSAAILVTPACDPDRAAELEELVARLVIDARTVRCEGGLADWVAALGAAEVDRVLVAVPGAVAPRIDRPLALIAWPDTDALVWTGEGGARLALLRVAAVLEAATSAADVDAWLDAIAAERVDDTALGIDDDLMEAC